MDIEKLGLGERIAGASAVLLFIFMFFDWFSVSISGGGVFDGASGGADAWDALDNIPIFLVIVILVVLAAVALRVTESGFEPPVSANTVIAILGAISVLLILFRIIDTPGGNSFVDVSPAFGIFISLIAAAGITYGGYLGMKAEGSDFRDLGSRFGGGTRA